MANSFPRQQARTRRFTLGAPRTFSVAPDGSRVLFLRSSGPEDPVTALWVYDVAAQAERLVAGGTPTVELTTEERARRERTRETADGIVTYATDHAHETGVFVAGGQLWHAAVASGRATVLPVAQPVFDPRIDPTGRRVAYCHGSTLRVIGVDGTGDAVVAAEADDSVTWGQAEFVAAEEMGRTRGYWGAPDGDPLLAHRAAPSPG